MERYCTKCGALVGEGIYCPKCGEKVFNPNEANRSMNTQNQSLKTPKKRSMPFFLKATLIILAGILAWIVLVVSADVIVSKIDSAINSPDTQVVDENLLTVDILIPAICFTEENPATAELTQEQKDAGFKSAKVNEDGSVTYTVSKKAFETIKEDMRLSTQKSLDEIPVESESIKSVEYNDDFSKVTFKVDKAVYENSLDSISVSLSSISCKLYQAYAGVPTDKMKTVITVVDVTTGEVISTKEYSAADKAEN